MNDPRIDLEQLNQQHEHFFGLTVRLQRFIAEGRAGWFDAPEVVRMALAFRHYAFFHFYAEEVYMIGLRYPEYFEHAVDARYGAFSRGRAA
jgi:hemerythrin